jgi:intracellular sulfur oxidation DsrE/DsrF family protein
MSQQDFRIERILHAYVDGELSAPEKSRLLVKMENDETIRERVCDLRRTKEWVTFSFEHETAPTRTLPSIRQYFWHTPVFHIAASVLVAILTFGAGWLGHSLQDAAPHNLALENINSGSQHVILHIGESDEARFASLVVKAEQILRMYQGSGVQVEVVANGGGLDLLRTASSRHIDDIKRMIATFNNVRFIACSKGLQRLRASGLDPIVIKGVDAHEPAADHLIQRLTEGWTYINI